MPPSRFHDDPQGDLVVESSDHHKSRVDSRKLAAMPDVFEGMLHVGQDNKQRETRVGLPVMEVSEKGEVVGLLLRYCLSPQAA